MPKTYKEHTINVNERWPGQSGVIKTSEWMFVGLVAGVTTNMGRNVGVCGGGVLFGGAESREC